jgi:accessory gene regulator B
MLLKEGEVFEGQNYSGRCRCQKNCGICTAQRCKSGNLYKYLPAEGTGSTEVLQKQQVMATAIAECITRNLIAASIIEEDDKELYVYGFFLLITRLFFLMLAITFGFCLKIPLESAIFYITFILLRSYAGGVHAKTETVCTILTTLAIGIATALIRMLESTNAKISLCFLFCNICLLAFSPLDSREKPLDAEEKCRYRKICFGLVFACDIVVGVAHFLTLPMLYYPVICGMCLETVLLSFGKMCNTR